MRDAFTFVSTMPRHHGIRRSAVRCLSARPLSRGDVLLSGNRLCRLYSPAIAHVVGTATLLVRVRGRREFLSFRCYFRYLTGQCWPIGVCTFVGPCCCLILMQKEPRHILRCHELAGGTATRHVNRVSLPSTAKSWLIAERIVNPRCSYARAIQKPRAAFGTDGAPLAKIPAIRGNAGVGRTYTRHPPHHRAHAVNWPHHVLRPARVSLREPRTQPWRWTFGFATALAHAVA